MPGGVPSSRSNDGLLAVHGDREAHARGRRSAVQSVDRDRAGRLGALDLQLAVEPHELIVARGHDEARAGRAAPAGDLVDAPRQSGQRDRGLLDQTALGVQLEPDDPARDLRADEQRAPVRAEARARRLRVRQLLAQDDRVVAHDQQLVVERHDRDLEPAVATQVAAGQHARSRGQLEPRDERLARAQEERAHVHQQQGRRVALRHRDDRRPAVLAGLPGAERLGPQREIADRERARSGGRHGPVREPAPDLHRAGTAHDRHELVAPIAVEVERRETRGPRLAGREFEARAQHDRRRGRVRWSVPARRGERERARQGEARDQDGALDHPGIVSPSRGAGNARDPVQGARLLREPASVANRMGGPVQGACPRAMLALRVAGTPVAPAARMQRSARNALLVALAGSVVVGLGFGAWWFLRDSPRPTTELTLAPAPALPAPAAPSDESQPQRQLELAVDDSPGEYGTLETTVVFPLEVDLALVRASSTLQAEDAPRLGSGATAKLAGSVRDAAGHGVRAEVRFVAGPNLGRTLYADSLGRFGADGLNPGLSVVKVTGPGIVGSQREVPLRPQREYQLNLGYGRPVVVAADVVDGEGKPIAGAKVTMDGQVATSAEDGLVEFAAVASGEVLVLVEKPGFASLRQALTLVGGSTIPRGQFKFRLDPGASLQVSITDALNAGQQALLFVLPVAADAERKFPWHTVNPVRIWPGGTAIVNDLPEGRVMLRLYHAGATAKPPKREVELHAGRRETIDFGLVPAPAVTGVVRDGDKPAQGAIVRMEAPDRAAATLSVFGQSNYLFLESDVLPDLPPAMQEGTTNERGEYQLSASEDAAPVRYLTALSRDGKRIGHAVLHPGDTKADLVLEPLVGGRGELAIQMEGRIQPLPVEITVEGTPRDPSVLPLGRDLRVADLPEGSWLVTVRWNGQVVTPQQPLEIKGETRLFDRAARGRDRRAGRRDAAARGQALMDPRIAPRELASGATGMVGPVQGARHSYASLRACHRNGRARSRGPTV